MNFCEIKLNVICVIDHRVQYVLITGSMTITAFKISAGMVSERAMRNPVQKF